MSSKFNTTRSNNTNATAVESCLPSMLIFESMAGVHDNGTDAQETRMILNATIGGEGGEGEGIDGEGPWDTNDFWIPGTCLAADLFDGVPSWAPSIFNLLSDVFFLEIEKEHRQDSVAGGGARQKCCSPAAWHADATATFAVGDYTSKGIDGELTVNHLDGTRVVFRVADPGVGNVTVVRNVSHLIVYVVPSPHRQLPSTSGLEPNCRVYLLPVASRMLPPIIERCLPRTSHLEDRLYLMPGGGIRPLPVNLWSSRRESADGRMSFETYFSGQTCSPIMSSFWTSTSGLVGSLVLSEMKSGIDDFGAFDDPTQCDQVLPIVIGGPSLLPTILIT